MAVYNHFNLRRPRCSRDHFRLNSAAALAQWRQPGAGLISLSSVENSDLRISSDSAS